MVPRTTHTFQISNALIFRDHECRLAPRKRDTVSVLACMTFLWLARKSWKRVCWSDQESRNVLQFLVHHMFRDRTSPQGRLAKFTIAIPQEYAMIRVRISHQTMRLYDLRHPQLLFTLLFRGYRTITCWAKTDGNPRGIPRTKADRKRIRVQLQ